MKYIVETVFKGVNQLSSVVSSMSNDVSGFTNRMERSFAKASTKLERINRGFQGMITGAGVAVAAIGLPMAKIVGSGMDFERAVLSGTSKLPEPLRAGTAEFDKIATSIKDVVENLDGASYKAIDGAKAFDEFASAGFDATQSMMSIKGAAELATAGQMDLGKTSLGLVDILDAFGLRTEDYVKNTESMARISGVLTEGARMATTDITQLMEAIKNGGDAAVASGSDIETFTALAINLANIKGEEAGTGLKLLYNRLIPTDESKQKLLNFIGVYAGYKKDVLDASGKVIHKKGDFRDQLDILEDLSKKMSKYTQVQRKFITKSIFGDEGKAAEKVMTLLAHADKGLSKIRKDRDALYAQNNATGRIASVMASDFKNTWDSVTRALDFASNAIYDKIRNPLQDILRKTGAWIKANKEVIATKLGDFILNVAKGMAFLVENIEPIAKGIATFAKFAAVLYGVEKAWKGITAALAAYNIVFGVAAAEGIFAAVGAGAVGAGAVGAGARTLAGGAALANPVAAFVALTTAIYLLIQAIDPIREFFDSIGNAAGNALYDLTTVGMPKGIPVDDPTYRQKLLKGDRDKDLYDELYGDKKSIQPQAVPQRQSMGVANFKFYTEDPNIKVGPLQDNWSPTGLKLLTSGGF